MLIVTTDELPGHVIRRVFGAVLAVAALGATPPSAQARREALERLAEEARRLGANAVIGMRFDTVSPAGVQEICAYGTAVRAEPSGDQGGRSEELGAGHVQQIQQVPRTPPGAPPMMARNLTVGMRRDPSH